MNFEQDGLLSDKNNRKEPPKIKKGLKKQTIDTRLLPNYTFMKHRSSKEDVAPLKLKQACLVNHGSEAHLILNTIGEACTSKTNDSLVGGVGT